MKDEDIEDMDIFMKIPDRMRIRFDREEEDIFEEDSWIEERIRGRDEE